MEVKSVKLYFGYRIFPISPCVSILDIQMLVPLSKMCCLWDGRHGSSRWSKVKPTSSFIPKFFQVCPPISLHPHNALKYSETVSQSIFFLLASVKCVWSQQWKLSLAHTARATSSILFSILIHWYLYLLFYLLIFITTYLSCFLVVF